MFEDISTPNSPSSPSSTFDVLPKPKHLLLDFSLVVGVDISAVETLIQAAKLCADNKCVLHVSGMLPAVSAALTSGGLLRQIASPETQWLQVHTDLDGSLGAAEDALLTIIGGVHEQQIQHINFRLRQNSESSDNSSEGFEVTLSLLSQHQGIDTSGLAGLAAFAKPLDFQAGDIIFDNETIVGTPLLDEDDNGLYFIEHGIISVERDPNQSTSTIGRSLRRSFERGSYTGRSKVTAAMKENRWSIRAAARTFRLARLRPGWCIGAEEVASGLRSVGVYRAETAVRVHHVSLRSVRELENDDPATAMALYRVLAHMMARRGDLLSERLGSTMDLLTAPPTRKPLSRQARLVLKDLSEHQHGLASQ